jgi:hypothetical protein
LPQAALTTPHTSDDDARTRDVERSAAVTRANWAVLQTGLITSGLAMFGVYVLATRINDLHLMGTYWPRYVPMGALVVGLIAGSGYVLASWWFGVQVTVRMLLVILLLQLGVFFASHYADFETLDLVYRDTGDAVTFRTYFHYTTVRLGTSDDFAPSPPPLRGYLIRTGEALVFSLGGLVSVLVLFGRPKCGACGGLLRRRTLGTIAAPAPPDLIKRLEDRAKAGDVKAFSEEIAAHEKLVSAEPESNVELRLYRCEVCGSAFMEQSPRDRRTPIDTDSAKRVDVNADFARTLFGTPREPV